MEKKVKNKKVLPLNLYLDTLSQRYATFLDHVTLLDRNGPSCFPVRQGNLLLLPPRPPPPTPIAYALWGWGLYSSLSSSYIHSLSSNVSYTYSCYPINQILKLVKKQTIHVRTGLIFFYNSVHCFEKSLCRELRIV